jgi:hypothetical protein
METAMCNGFDTECPVAYRPDGSVCAGGMCVHGQCIIGVDPTDDDTTHEIHVHHTRDGNNELITITTTRKSDGSTFTKEHLIETNKLHEAQRNAEELAMENLKKITEEKKAAKAKIREEQYEKDVSNMVLRLEEAEKARLANMTHEELEVANNKTAAAGKNEKKAVEKSPQELDDESPEHVKFVESLNNDNNPIRYLKSHKVPQAQQQCAAGLCCNKHVNVFFPYGHLCGQPADPCKVGICSGQSSECYSVGVADGFKCPQGRCFDGECIKDCYGECCDGSSPKEDGEECETSGKCFNGVCVKPCYGDCCELGQNFAKPDGAPCIEGTCQEGRCVGDELTTSTEAGAAGAADPLGGNKAIAVVLDEGKKATDLEAMWSKVIDEEHKVHEAHKTKVQQERQAELAADKQNSNNTSLLQTSTTTSTENKYWLAGMIGAGGLVGLLVIILVIVLVVSRSHKKEQAKKQAQDSEYYYEKF